MLKSCDDYHIKSWTFHLNLQHIWCVGVRVCVRGSVCVNGVVGGVICIYLKVAFYFEQPKGHRGGDESALHET